MYFALLNALLKGYGSQKLELGCLNIFGPHMLIGSGTTKRFCLVEGSVVLME